MRAACENLEARPLVLHNLDVHRIRSSHLRTVILKQYESPVLPLTVLKLPHEKTKRGSGRFESRACRNS